MKKYHPFIVIGAIGLAISLIFHLAFLTLGIVTPAYWANYTVWFVFLTIGIAKNRSFQATKTTGYSKS